MGPLGRGRGVLVSMMSEHVRPVARWLPWLDLACASIAAGLWYAFAQPWPLCIALTPWAIRFALTRRWTRRTPFDVPMALFLLTAGVGIWVAADRAAAWARFWVILGAVFLFYALANAESARDLRTWYVALLGAAVAVVFVLANDWGASTVKIGLLTRLGQALQASLPPLPDPDVNPNVAGAILAMSLPFAVWAAVQAWRRRRDARQPGLAALALGLALAALFLVAFGLLMTASRGAWVAVLGALLLASAWLLAGRVSRGSAARNAVPPSVQGRIFAGGLGLALLAAVLWIAARPGTVAVLLDALPGPSAVGSRTDLWRNGLTLAGDYPFTGVGLDGFMMAYSSYVMLLHVGFTPHAHNLYLDLALQQGLPGLLVFLWMCALFGRVWWREALQPGARRRRGELAAAALSLAVILPHGLVDDTLYASRAVLFLFVPLAFAGLLPAEHAGWSTERGAGDVAPQGAPRRTWLAVLGGTIVLLAVALLWRAPLLSRLASNVGAVRQTQTELSVYTWPEWPIQDEVRRQRDLGPAVDAFERALALDAGNASANRRLGQIELSLGQYEAALGHLQAARAAEPWNLTTQQLLGEAYLANGEQEVGRALWAGVSNEELQLELRAWWYDHIGEVERAAWMRWAAGR